MHAKPLSHLKGQQQVQHHGAEAANAVGRADENDDAVTDAALALQFGVLHRWWD